MCCRRSAGRDVPKVEREGEGGHSPKACRRDMPNVKRRTQVANAMCRTDALTRSTEHAVPNELCRTRSVEAEVLKAMRRRHVGGIRRTRSAEREAPNVKRRTRSAEREAPNVKHRTRSAERDVPNAMCRTDALTRCAERKCRTQAPNASAERDVPARHPKRFGACRHANPDLQ